MPLFFPARRVLSCVLVFALAACSPAPSPSDLLARARQALASGDLDAAVIDAKSALQQDTGNAEGRRLLGEAYYLQRQLEPAIEEFARSLAVRPDPAVAARYGAALVASARSQYLVELHQRGDFAYARGNVDFMATLAHAQAQAGDTVAAESTLAVARELGADSPALLLAEAAVTLHHAGDLARASAMLSELTQRYPEYADGWSLLGSVALTQGKVELAESAISQALALNPNRSGDRLLLVSLLLDRGALELAEEQLRPAVKAAPQHPAVLYARARLLLAEDQAKAALDVLQQLLAVAPDHSPGVYLAGIANLREANLATAHQQFSQFLSVQPGHLDARLLQASVHLQLGETDRAREIAREILSEYPDNMPARQMLAASTSGKLTEIAILHQVAAYSLAEGRDERARALYERLRELAPDDLVALNNLAWIERSRDPERALTLIDRALVVAPAHAGVLDTKAMILSQQGRHDDALAVNRRSLEASQANPAYRLSQARILDAGGERDAARQVLAQLLADHDPFEGRPEAEALLRELEATGG